MKLSMDIIQKTDDFHVVFKGRPTDDKTFASPPILHLHFPDKASADAYPTGGVVTINMDVTLAFDPTK